MVQKKKLFVSVPMKGRTEENIKISIDRMHRIAEIMMDEELELIDSMIDKTPPKGVVTPVWYLGESIKKLAGADLVVGLAEIDGYDGCILEREIALRYGIPYIRVFAEQAAVDLLFPENQVDDAFSIEIEESK